MTQNKNIWLVERGLEVLRALKYDLDESDGAIMERALETRAIERLREHVEEVNRMDRGHRRGHRASATEDDEAVPVVRCKPRR